jgi:hypothetical protein
MTRHRASDLPLGQFARSREAKVCAHRRAFLHAAHGRARKLGQLAGYHPRSIEYWWQDGDHEEPPSLKLSLATLGLLALADLEPTTERRELARRSAVEPFLLTCADLDVLAIFLSPGEAAGEPEATDCAALAKEFSDVVGVWLRKCLDGVQPHELDEFEREFNELENLLHRMRRKAQAAAGRTELQLMRGRRSAS